MNEPLSATTVIALAGTTGFVAWWTNLDVSVVMGAFMGAVFFVISSVDLSRLVRAGYFSVSFFIGIVAAPIATEVMSGVLRTQARVPEALGALFMAAIAIKLLLFGTSPAGLRASQPLSHALNCSPSLKPSRSSFTSIYPSNSCRPKNSTFK